MHEIIAVPVYQIDELSGSAREKARCWYRDFLHRFSWWDAVYEDFLQICGILGVDIATFLPRGAVTPEQGGPCLYFRGFSNQGDGASFEGIYRYERHASHEIRRYAPRDTQLHAIADTLAQIQRRNFYQLIARMSQTGPYYHEFTMTVTVIRESQTGCEMTEDAAQILSDVMRDLARWLYRSLETAWDYESSDDAVDEAIRINEYTFTTNGIRFG